MTKPKPAPLGSSIEVPNPSEVIRPGGSEGVTVVGGLYVLDVEGTHTINGKAVEVGPAEEPAAG